MIVETNIEDPRWSEAGLGALAETAARVTFAHLGMGTEGFAISLLGCDDARIAELNADFRGKPSPTNVLSWPSEDRAPDVPPAPGSAGEPEELGDIAIAYQTCQREAEAAGLSLGDHVTHLMVHAILHLLGHDHEEDAEAALMEGLETAILAELGLNDPYA